MASVAAMLRNRFQFPPLREVRRYILRLLILHSYFNSRPCARGDALLGDKAAQERIFQFPPLREGRQPAYAPPLCYIIFQFPPLREGRQISTENMWRNSYFNSRPCARGDSATAIRASYVPLISIPAPARGATFASR